MFGAGILSCIAILTGMSLRYFFGKVSPFVAGICRCLRERPTLWDYDADESWLCSEDAHLSISLQTSNFGRCNSYLLCNRGSLLITTFSAADAHAFKKAYRDWKELTAIERQHVAERRKSEALKAMTA
jgi:hypothetical protein